MSKTLASAMQDIWHGFQYIGILNGIPAGKDPLIQEDATHEKNTDPTCFKGKDGTEYWRNVGLGSV